MAKILVVVDMQNDFVTGSLGTPEARAIVQKVKQVVDATDYDLLIFTQDTHSDNYSETLEGQLLPIEHCVFGSEGWQIIDELNKVSKSIKITKNTFGHCNIASYIPKNVSEITLVGLCTDICVISNALILRSFFPNAKMKIIANATAGTTPAAKEAALTVARSCLIEVVEDISEVVKND